MRARTRRLVLLALLPVALGCEGAEEGGAQRELVVFAASSLTEAFDALEARFETANPGVDVRCQYAGSQTLRAQLENGAAADVFASADAPHVEALARAGLVTSAEAFAANELVVAVPRDEPTRVASAAELGRAERIVLGAPSVPLGAYTDRFLERGDALFGEGFRAQVLARVVSREGNARLVLAKVALGEADAAVVYATDALASEHAVRSLPIPAEGNVRPEYVAAVLRDAREPELGRRWVELLLSAEGARVLEGCGFGRPAEDAR